MTYTIEIVSLLPDLRAKALFKCGDQEVADQLVEVTLLRAIRDVDSLDRDSFVSAEFIEEWLVSIMSELHSPSVSGAPAPWFWLDVTSGKPSCN